MSYKTTPWAEYNKTKKSNMKQLELLEQELLMMQENIDRVRAYKKERENDKWTPSHSVVVGELKHRAIALKQRLTLVSVITTNSLFEK